MGGASSRLYDGAGRVEEEIDALGNSTTYGYDVAGRLETITDVALSATTTFVRDSAGRVTDTVDALGNTTHTAYRLGGRLDSTTNARGFTTSFDRTPTSIVWSPFDDPRTAHNTIFLNDWLVDEDGDIAAFTLVHEVAHVWQGQNAGWWNLYYASATQEIIEDGWQNVLLDEDDRTAQGDQRGIARRPNPVWHRFLLADIEAQADAIAKCSALGTWPSQCGALLSYIQNCPNLYTL